MASTKPHQLHVAAQPGCSASHRLAGSSAPGAVVRRISVSSDPQDATKADMARRTVDRLRKASGRPVAPAVVRGAQVRTSLEDLPSNSEVRLTRIVALLLADPARVLREAARARSLGPILA